MRALVELFCEFKSCRLEPKWDGPERDEIPAANLRSAGNKLRHESRKGGGERIA